MDFSFTDEQELLVESIEEFCERYAGEDEIKEMYENCLLRRFCYAVPRAAATPFRGWPIRADAATVRPTRGARAPLLA